MEYESTDCCRDCYMTAAARQHPSSSKFCSGNPGVLVAVPADGAIGADARPFVSMSLGVEPS